MKDKIAESLKEIDMSEMKVPFVAVYGPNQVEYPGKYVARVFDAEEPTNMVIVKDNLEELQQDIKENRPWMLIGAFMKRGAEDDPALIGVWL